MPSALAPVKLSVLLTSHNRRELTLEALRALHAAVPPHAVAEVFLTDDGSTDGTSEAVASEFPDVRIIKGDGNLYWNRGMLAAWQAATETQQDFFVWLNDDLAMAPDVLGRMLSAYDNARARLGEKVVIVGKTVSPTTQTVTYGAFGIGEGISRLRFRRLRAGEATGRTMNGNLVLLPARLKDDVGLLDSRFTHSFGDIDYGLRASDAGYTLIEMETPVGFQEYNVAWERKLSSITSENWRFILFHPKGLPWREWLHFCRRHGGPIWPVNFFVRYLKLVMANYR